jgi:DNA-binding CsgD family transcriptional regulator
MLAERSLMELVGLVYEAAGDVERWTLCLERLRAELKAATGFFYLHNLRDHVVDVQAQIGVDAAYLRSYEEYYAAKNVILTHAPHRLVPGKVFLSRQLCPDRIFLKSELYNDWAVPQHLGYGMSATVLRTPSVVGMVGFLRKTGAPDPSVEDLMLLRALMPHLERAVQMHQHIAELRVLQGATKQALDRWARGVVILDGRGRALLMNRTAEEIVNLKDGLGVVEGQLRAAVVGETIALRRLIRNAVASRNTPVLEPGGVMSVTRARSPRPLHLLVTPVPTASDIPTPRRAACVVFIADPDKTPQTNERLLRRLYGLTPTEARIAALLTQGTDIRAISETLQVTLNTVRTHVKRVFDKTETNRQSDLTRLVLTTVAAAPEK